MREIKFEFAGQQSDGKWILSRPFTLNEIGIGWVHQFVASSNPPVHFDKLIARQFTGLKDKNGKEIYESDLCHYEDNETLIKVRWSDIQARFILDALKGDNWLDGFYNFNEVVAQDLTVIGNCYENPKLLKSRTEPKL